MSARPRIERLVRFVAISIAALCVAMAVAAPMPGYTTYRDRNDCLGNAIGNVFSFEHRDSAREPCIKDYQPVETRRAAGWEILCFLIPMAGCAALIAWRPRRRWGVLWSAMTIALTVVWVVVTFDLDFDFSGDRIELHAAAHVTQWSVAAIYVLHLVQLVAIGVHAIVVRLAAARAAARAREPAPDPMPKAIVVKD